MNSLLKATYFSSAQVSILLLSEKFGCDVSQTHLIEHTSTVTETINPVIVIGDSVEHKKTNENVFSKKELKKMQRDEKNLRKAKIKKSKKVIFKF